MMISTKVVINPYKRYPIYTHRVCKIYLGKRRNECPPHLWYFNLYHFLSIPCIFYQGPLRRLPTGT